MLSAVIITYNERRNLARCLTSLEGVTDEVVVVDSGSTDGTQALGESMGARVIHRAWTTYADQKNWAADQAKFDHVLSLDADEALSDGLRQEIQAWRETDHPGQAAWSMPRLTSYVGQWVRHGGWYPDRKIRLWRKGTGRWTTVGEGVQLHEAWVPEPSHASSVGQFRSDLLHYSFHSHAEHRRKWAHYATLGAKDALAMNRASGPWTPWIRPAFQWLKQWVIQGGWRDGATGWTIARRSALAAHWKWRQVRHPFVPCKVGVVGEGPCEHAMALAGALKAYSPESEVVWIGDESFVSTGKTSRHVDEVREKRDDPSKTACFRGLDAVLCLAPTHQAMKEAKDAGVRTRVGRGRSLGAIRWCNRRVRLVSGHPTLQALQMLHALHLPAAHRFPEAEDWSTLV